MAVNQTISIMTNRYGVNKVVADYINDLIYSVFFSESGPGVYNRITGWKNYKELLQNPNDANALTSLAYVGAGISPDELLPIIQSQAKVLLDSGAYSDTIADVKVSLMLVEETSKGKAITWKIQLMPAEGATLPLIAAIITGAVVKQIS